MNTTTVTHPDGTIDKRTSKSHTYTHAVVVHETADHQRAFLAAEVAGMTALLSTLPADHYYHGRIVELRSAAEAATDTWAVWSWSGSEALAAKAAKGIRPAAGRTVHVVAVDA